MLCTSAIISIAQMIKMEYHQLVRSDVLLEASTWGRDSQVDVISSDGNRHQVLVARTLLVECETHVWFCLQWCWIGMMITTWRKSRLN